MPGGLGGVLHGWKNCGTIYYDLLGMIKRIIVTQKHILMKEKFKTFTIIGKILF